MLIPKHNNEIFPFVIFIFLVEAFSFPFREVPSIYLLKLNKTTKQDYVSSFDFYQPADKEGLPWWLSGKESTCQAGDSGLIPGWGRSPGEGNGNPLQYCCLGNPMDRGAWWATVPGVAKESDTTEQQQKNNKKADKEDGSMTGS